MLRQLYENYTLERDEESVSAGLLPIPFERFEHVIGGKVSSGSADAATLIKLGIAFPGERQGGPSYTTAAVSFGGMVVLVDPNTIVANAAAAFAHVCADVNDNTTIRASFTHQSMLLCPWWDPTQVTAPRDFYDLTAETPLFFGTQKYGFIPYEAFVPPIHMRYDGGVLFAARVDTPRGTCSVFRWNTLASESIESNLLQYEVVLYENGDVEFRYAATQDPDRNGQPSTSVPSVVGQAVVGLFFPSGSNRFRDASLPSPIVARERHQWGGYASDPSYVDPFNATPYCSTNNVGAAWPGAIQGRATYTFGCPRELRDILPRAELRKRSSISNGSSLFSSRRAIPAISGTLESPVALSYGDLDGTGGSKRGLFTGELRCIRNRALDDVRFMLEGDASHTIPFDDRVIDDPHLTFASASSIDTDVPSYTMRIGSREVITITKRLNCTTKFLPERSSVVQYCDAVQQFAYVSVGAMKLASDESQRAAEDALGFNAVGHWVASGTTGPTSHSQSTRSPGLYGDSTPSDAELLGTYYGGSLSLNDGYTVSDVAGITLNSKAYDPINLELSDPFVVESVELEIPIIANSAWMQQYTQVLVNNPLLLYSGWNVGGPGITFAITVDRGSQLRKFRDVIVTGSLTHANDANLVSWSIRSLGAGIGIVSPVGMQACGGTPAAIVRNTTGSFTGSVIMRMPVAAAVGSYMAITGSTDPDTFVQTLASSPTIPKRDGAWNWVGALPVHLTPFGRSHDGTTLSARSYIAREASFGKTINNPFYVTGSDLAALALDISNLGLTSVRYAGAGVAIACNKSPYVLLPGDHMRIYASRGRSAITGSAGLWSQANSDAEIGPIVGIGSGSMRMSLIGRRLREGALIELPGPQPSEVGVIGDDHVLDQIEFFSPEDLYGTTFDNYITGSYVEFDGTRTRPVDNRGVIFSRVNASASQYIDTTLRSIALTRPHELAGFTWVNCSTCDDERYYDSMLPPIDAIVRLDGGSMLFQTSSFYTNGANHAIVFFDIPTQHTASIAAYSDNIWSRAFPFEPRYSSLQRHVDVTRYYITDATIRGNIIAGVDAAATKTISSDLVVVRMPYTNARETAVSPAPGNLYYFFSMDAVGDNPPRVITPPITNVTQRPSDLIKTLYGIGSVNAIVITGSSPPMGSTCAVDYAGISMDPASSHQYTFGTKPIVRGWKYGIVNGLPQLSRAVWRRNRYGQLRDMLEQRIDTKFAVVGQKLVVGSSPVRVTFVSALTGDVLDPLLTTSSNLSYEATSSLPYFDGDVRNR